MKIRDKFLIPLVTLIIVAVVITVFFVSNTVRKLVTEHNQHFTSYSLKTIAEQAQQRRQSIYASIDQMSKSALEIATLFTELPEVQQAYRIALQGDLNNENDPQMQLARQYLRQHIRPYLEGHKKQTGVTLKLHFHTASNRSLVRLWRRGWQAKRHGKKVDVSDDLSSFRKTVVTINSGDHKPIAGIEIGRGGFAIRGLASIDSATGKHLGSCEILLPFSQAVAQNRSDDKYNIAAYMLADKLSIATKLKNNPDHPVIGDKYVFISSTDAPRTNQILTASLLDAGYTKEAHEVVGNNFVSTFPIRDFSGATVGVMALVYDLTEITTLASDLQASGEKTSREVRLHFAIGGLIMVLLATLLIYLITRTVVEPVKQTALVAEEIARGELGSHINYTGRNAVAKLATAINTMINYLEQKAAEATQISHGNLGVNIALASEQDVMGHAFADMVKNLKEIVDNISLTAAKIDSSCAQFASSAQRLSDNSSASAASIEEISSAIHEIENQTRNNASNAERASTLAQNAQDTARTGNDRMGKMVVAMDEINEAGQNIGKIIKVIDEIAFQTNLLALNAAVEAARAGQHGKGFAVVAEEVRNLAARSAKAAEETGQLIEGAIAKSNNGAKIAAITAETLEEIVGSTAEVTQLINEIASVGEQQVQGISQVNHSLEQIDHAVQQNTASAEESAAAAQELSTLSAQLEQLLQRFSTNGQTAALPPGTNDYQ